ncbi:MAG: thiol oxidoreductase, partial [Anaerolineae bacterium]|nr:thiol oxidoreductase [Anaerolineae bacterium]
MKRRTGFPTAAMAALAAAGSVMAEVPLAEPHPAQPRTAEEAARVAAAVAPSALLQAFEDRPGGTATVAARTGADAFSQPLPGLSPDEAMDFRLGNALFRKLWIAAPASTRASDGLGPLW